MTIIIKKLIFISILFLSFTFNSFADSMHFIDFNKVLNGSKSGAQAQKKLQEKFKTESSKFSKLEKEIRNEEKEIISQKKTISAEDYKKKVEDLRKKVANLQKNKKNSFKNLAESRKNARKTLIKALDPILKKYMEDNSIKIIVDKQAVVRGDVTLEITNQIIAILNKELPSLKIN